MSTLQQITEIFIDVLDDEDIVLSAETIADDIEEWDSLAHIQLIVAIEKAFKVKFTTSEIQQWQNVGDMCSLIDEKM